MGREGKEKRKKESWKHFIQTNIKNSAELQWIEGKRHRERSKTSNAMKLWDVWAKVDESPIKEQGIPGCCDYANTMLLSLVNAIELWDIVHFVKEHAIKSKTVWKDQ